MLGEHDFVNPLVAMSTHVMRVDITATQRNATQRSSRPSQIYGGTWDFSSGCVALGGMGFTRNASFLVCAGQQTDAIRLLHQRVPQKKKIHIRFRKNYEFVSKA